MRMLLAIVCSIIFTFIYAALAAKSRRAEMVLIPLLDILQSVPILGFLTFTVVFFLNLFPGRCSAQNSPACSRSSPAWPGT
jgi:NitT/TauT family transport system permease protein